MVRMLNIALLFVSSFWWRRFIVLSAEAEAKAARHSALWRLSKTAAAPCRPNGPASMTTRRLQILSRQYLSLDYLRASQV